MASPLTVALDGEPLIGRRTGVGRLCEGLITALAARGDLDVGVFAVTWRSRRLLERELPPGARLVGKPLPARPVRALWRSGLDLPVAAALGSPDVVHGTNAIVPPARRAARVVTVHDLAPLHFPEACHPATLVYPQLIGRAVRRGAWVHTTTRFVADEVIGAFGADPQRVRVVPPGVPALPRGGRLPKATPPGPYILAVGTVEPRKDYPGLVRAFDLLAGARPDLSLVIVGADAWGADALAGAVAASPHRGRIVRPGWLDDAEVAELLRRAAVLAYPSRYEGFGFPPLQAMAEGVPVVATAAGSIPEVVGDAARVVSVGDVEGLAAALAATLDRPTGGTDRERAGRDRAALFTWEAMADGIRRLYLDAAG